MQQAASSRQAKAVVSTVPVQDSQEGDGDLQARDETVSPGP